MPWCWLSPSAQQLWMALEGLFSQLHFSSLQLAMATAGEHCPPFFSPVLNHGGREKEGRKDRSAKSQNWQMTVQGSGYLGEFPPVSASKGSRVEQPGPHTPATLRMTTGSLVSMTEPRSHDVPSTTTRLLWLLQQLGCLLHPMRAR